jgi:hypothetical protein
MDAFLPFWFADKGSMEEDLSAGPSTSGQQETSAMTSTRRRGGKSSSGSPRPSSGTETNFQVVQTDRPAGFRKAGFVGLAREGALVTKLSWRGDVVLVVEFGVELSVGQVVGRTCCCWEVCASVGVQSLCASLLVCSTSKCFHMPTLEMQIIPSCAISLFFAEPGFYGGPFATATVKSWGFLRRISAGGAVHVDDYSAKAAAEASFTCTQIH